MQQQQQLKLHRTLARSYQRVFSSFFLSDISLICKREGHTWFPQPTQAAKNEPQSYREAVATDEIASKLRTCEIVIVEE